MFLKPQPHNFGLPNQERLDSVPYLKDLIKVTKRNRWIAYQFALRSYEGVIAGVIILTLGLPIFH
jgi:hypothetical protein